jgi:hypothetical protein
MDNFFISLTFALCFLLGLGVFLYFAFGQRMQEKGLLTSFYFREEVSRAEKIKKEVEYHLDWARHSGDKERVQALESQILRLDLSISELTTK